MSNLYNLIFGFNPMSHMILAAIGLTVAEFGRPRDCQVIKTDDGEYRIAMYTRNGGKNRPQHMPDFTWHPNYLYDKDDDFDNTYATIYFSIPAEHLHNLKEYSTKDIPISDKIRKLVADMKAGKKTALIDKAVRVERVMKRSIIEEAKKG